MKARSIKFRDTVRTGPGVSDRKDNLHLTDQGFGAYGGYGCGTIEVDLKQGTFTVTSTRKDPVTGEPVVAVGPFVGMVAFFEPLTVAQEAVFYPKAEKAA